MKILPPFWAMIYLAVGLALHSLWLWMGQGRFSIPLLGILSLGAGFSLVIWAWKIFHQLETAVHPLEDPKHFVEKGPYRFTRNPMYLGMTLILLGIAFVAGTLPSFITPVAFALTINATFIPYEEKKMERLFNDPYLAYKNRVRRWI